MIKTVCVYIRQILTNNIIIKFQKYTRFHIFTPVLNLNWRWPLHNITISTLLFKIIFVTFE